MFFSHSILLSVVIIVAFLAFAINLYERPKSFQSQIPPRVVPRASYIPGYNSTHEPLTFGTPATQLPDTTAIILNWSRFPNVVQIVSSLCGRSSAATIASVLVWNNNPRVKLTHKDFLEAQCIPGRLQIHNSPSNMYFHARFVACAQVITPYCFIQDDDYIIWPEIINTLRSQISRLPTSRIHLLPPHEKFTSDLRTIRTSSGVHTSFAWLGHGTLIRRSHAVDFLALLGQLNISKEELRMADNYFTILGNTFPDIWFDQGVELGGGEPFTVGPEGEERNRHHIMKAARMLDSIIACTGPACAPHAFNRSVIPFMNQEYIPDLPPVSRAPCVGTTCLLETSISVLPEIFNSGVLAADQIFSLEASNAELIGGEHKSHYCNYPPSHAVDGRPETAFRSFKGRWSLARDHTLRSYGRWNTDAKAGDAISLDIIRNVGADGHDVEMVFLVDVPTEDILRAAKFETGVNGNWIASRHSIFCLDSAVVQPQAVGYLRECSILMSASEADVQSVGAHVFRVYLDKDIDRHWCIHEIWLRDDRS